MRLATEGSRGDIQGISRGQKGQKGQKGQRGHSHGVSGDIPYSKSFRAVLEIIVRGVCM